MGKRGSKAFYRGISVEKEGIIQKNTIDTTGAGDTFCGCILNFVLEHGLEDLTESSLIDMITFANVAASIITTRRGAIRSMPSKKEILKFI